MPSHIYLSEGKLRLSVEIFIILFLHLIRLNNNLYKFKEVDPPTYISASFEFKIFEIFLETLLGRFIHELFQLEIRFCPHSSFITFFRASLVCFESIPREFPSKYNLSSG